MGKRRKKSGISKAHCLVYGLYDHEDKLRYIGQTRSSIDDRFGYHKRNAFTSGSSPVAIWLFSELRANRDVSIIEIDSNATWNVSEILWIDRFKREGADLLNMTRGGDDTLHDMKREGLYKDKYRENIKREKAHERAAELGISIVQPMSAFKSEIAE